MSEVFQRNMVLLVLSEPAGEQCSPLQVKSAFATVGDGVPDVPAFGTNACASMRTAPGKPRASPKSVIANQCRSTGVAIRISGTPVTGSCLRRPYFLCFLAKENRGKERPLSFVEAFPATVVPYCGSRAFGTWERI